VIFPCPFRISAQFGFSPRKDFKLSQYVLEDKNSVELCDNIEFGKDGQPYYVAGPNDNVEYIMRQLESKAGEENFKYLYRSDECFHEAQD